MTLYFNGKSTTLQVGDIMLLEHRVNGIVLVTFRRGETLLNVGNPTGNHIYTLSARSEDVPAIMSFVITLLGWHLEEIDGGFTFHEPKA